MGPFKMSLFKLRGGQQGEPLIYITGVPIKKKERKIGQETQAQREGARETQGGHLVKMKT